MAATPVDEVIRELATEEAFRLSIDPFSESRSNQKNSEPGDKREIIKRSERGAEKTKRNKPVSFNRQKFS